MATITNADGTITEVKISQEEVVAKKKRGPAKKFDFERKTISAMVNVTDYDNLVKAFGSPTNAVNELIKLWNKGK